MLTELTELLDSHFTQDNQYILLSDIKNSIKTKFSRTAIDINFSKSLNIVMANLSLQKKKASKSIKVEFDIDADDFPYIIVRCN